MGDRRADPIGVFDSGMGGLTVLEVLRRVLPHEHFIYLGDTARLPYGTKSPQTVQRYAVQAARILVERGVKALVIACNTASAVALPVLQARYAPLPVYGVVEPGARAATAHAGRGPLVVLATESTVRGGAYQRALLALRPDLKVLARPCPLLVTLAEEGRHSGPLVDLALTEYLRGVLPPAAHSTATLLLGCTHFPVFRGALQGILTAAGAGDAAVVDSAETTARAVAAELDAGHLAAAPENAAGGTLVLLATDGRERFRRVGAYFLGHPLDDVELVDL